MSPGCNFVVCSKPTLRRQAYDVRVSDAAPSSAVPPAQSAAEERRLVRIEWSIAAGAFLASFAMNFWWPFLPLFLQDIGATSDANALFWVAIATSVQGVARLVTGPVWGVLSDQYGRKLMLVRALYAATFTTVIAAVAQAPWVIVVSLAMQGLLSGFIPAAVALTTVSVPEARISRSLGIVTAGQYLGGTIGPVTGAWLAEFVGYRGAIVASAILPALAATWIIFAVPRDSVTLRVRKKKGEPAKPAANEPKESMWKFGQTFWIAVALYFGLFALNQLIRTATPIALKDRVGGDSAASYSGWAFSAGGVGSVIAVFLFPRLVRNVGHRKQLVLLRAGSGLDAPAIRRFRRCLLHRRVCGLRHHERRCHACNEYSHRRIGAARGPGYGLRARQLGAGACVHRRSD